MANNTGSNLRGSILRGENVVIMKPNNLRTRCARLQTALLRLPKAVLKVLIILCLFTMVLLAYFAYQLQQIGRSHISPVGTFTIRYYNKSELVDFFMDQDVPNPLCDGIFRNDPQAIGDAADFMKFHQKNFIRDDDFVHVIDSLECDGFRKIRGYPRQSTSDEEAQFPIAFSIMMFRDVEQFERLLRAIYAPQNYYCVHVDAKSPYAVHRGVEAILSCFDNVFMVSKMETVYWGHINALKADLNCMKDLLRIGKWKYFINLTGQEFPLVSNRELVRILMAYNGSNDIEGNYPIASYDRHRTTNVWEFGKRGFQKTNKLKSQAPHNIKILKGSVHIVASRAFVDFSIYDPRAIEFLHWLEDTFVPDETFFPSLNHDFGLCAPGGYFGDPSWKQYTARFKIWFHNCRGKYVRYVCVLGIGDLARLMTDNKQLFVNKLHQDYEYLTIDCLEQYHRNMTYQSSLPIFEFDDSYYRNLPFVNTKQVC